MGYKGLDSFKNYQEGYDGIDFSRKDKPKDTVTISVTQKMRVASISPPLMEVLPPEIKVEDHTK